MDARIPGLSYNVEMHMVVAGEGLRMGCMRGEEQEVGVGVVSGGQEGAGGGQGFRLKQGNATEPFSMRACSRHQVGGGAVGEQDKSPRAVSLNNPGLWR